VFSFDRYLAGQPVCTHRFWQPGGIAAWMFAGDCGS
jgi:hypothetical protein